MNNPGIELLINICITLIFLVVARILLKEWDRRAKLREAQENAVEKLEPKKNSKK